jgi:hypothetical protein
MGWTWRYESASGALVELAEQPAPVPADGFPGQGDAESWLGEFWQQLLDAGVDQVTLMEDEREVYGPMSLHPPEG